MTPLAAPHPDLLRLAPLGGLGEIGMNCLALEQSDGILVVDCGITFPDENLGIDIIHPDFRYLEERRDRVHGVFLTHGHEDHVGALPYLLERLAVPVYGPPHALAVARHRLFDKNMDPDAFRFVTTAPRTTYRVGPFDVEPIRVTHSITEATALAIRTRAGTVIHTGDFRFDPDPPDSELTDEARFCELGDEGVRLLLSDSTNIDAKSAHISETEVGHKLEELIGAARGRVVLGMFASNMQRLALVGEIARRLGRKMALFGRSIELHVEWGHDIGKLRWPSDLLVARDQAASIDPARLLVLAGGTQAEPGSSLSRLAARTHPALTLARGDTLILSSRIIPGNDRPVFAMMAEFLRQGVEIKTWISDPAVHTSGHAHRDEQRHMLELVRPRAFLPVHGTRHHLERHAALARELSVAEVLVIENGETAEVSPAGFRREGRFEAGRVATWQGLPIAGPVLRERRALARAGAVTISLVVDGRGSLKGPPSVVARGVMNGEDEPGTLRFVALEVAKALQHTAERDETALSEMARLAARRAIEAKTGRKPVCIVSVIRI